MVAKKSVKAGKLSAAAKRVKAVQRPGQTSVAIAARGSAGEAEAATQAALSAVKEAVRAAKTQPVTAACSFSDSRDFRKKCWYRR